MRLATFKLVYISESEIQTREMERTNLHDSTELLIKQLWKMVLLLHLLPYCWVSLI